MPSIKVIHHILVAAHQAKLFSNKIFSLNSVLLIVYSFIVIWDFITILCNIDIHNLTSSIPVEKIHALYSTNWLCWHCSAETLSKLCRALVFQFNQLCQLHPLGSCVSSNRKLMSFMHFHNSCTRNCDHHILLIMIANSLKESCHKLSLILVFVVEEGLKLNQNWL